MLIEINDADYKPACSSSSLWNIEGATYDASTLTYQEFFEKHLIKNVPCIIKNITSTWECTEKWISNDNINYDYLIQTYGDLEASVADCGEILDYAQRTSSMKVDAFLNYMQEPYKNKILYLKDLHLKKLRPKDNFYKVPDVFISDWLNEYALDKNEDDFRFVYIGPKHSWTPLHVDVYCSFSWSVNIIGRKKWIIFPPGDEDNLKNEQNQLQLLFDPDKNKDVKHYVIFQEQGDAIFVPSGWYHQVENLKDTISINHNWNNGCNIRFMWELLNKTLIDVELEIDEFKESPDHSLQCQILLKALCGANYESFMNILSHIAKKRLAQLTRRKRERCDASHIFGKNHITFDLKMINNVIQLILQHPNFKNGKILIDDCFLQLKQNIIDAITS